MSIASRLRSTAGSVYVLCGGVFLACTQPPLVVDSASNLEISIDGAYEDWAGRFTRIDGRRSVGLAIAHDSGNLYLCLVTRDFDVQTLLRRAGFTVWLDPDGGQQRRLGLRVAPIARDEDVSDATVTPKIEIVREGAEYGYQLAAPGPDAPVDAKTAQRSDVVVYEFRIARSEPLARDAHLPLAAGRPLGVGIVSEAYEPPEAPNGSRRGDGIDPFRVWVIGRT